MSDAAERLARATRGVAQQITAAAGSSGNLAWDFRVATVTATSPLTIDYGDGVTIPDVGRLAGYSPTIGDIVWVQVRAPVAIVIDKLA